jgi:hypothetical protein
MSAMEITRRQMLGASAGMALAGYSTLGARPAAASTRSRVVLIRDPYVLDADGKVREPVIGAMLDKAVTRLFDETDPDKAWKKLIRPEDTVGVKSNVWRELRTPPELEQVLVRRVVGAGVPPDRVAVDDRGVLRNPVFLNSTALINVRPLRTHHWSGVGSLIKNYIMFVPDPPRYHPDSCADLAAIWKLPLVAGKTRLNILVMLTPLFYGVGGHHYDPAYVWRYCGLLVGTDPVAVDATGLRILLNKRRAHFGEERRMQPPAKHIEIADTRHGLGTADPSKIEIITLGWTDDLLL